MKSIELSLGQIEELEKQISKKNNIIYFTCCSKLLPLEIKLPSDGKEKNIINVWMTEIIEKSKNGAYFSNETEKNEAFASIIAYCEAILTTVSQT